ncbi:MAG: MarR family transcriptional regulator [Verrucomicrobiaceae bacterium]
MENSKSSPSSNWSFLTNHTHVLVCLSRDNTITVRQLAILIGITERSVQRILNELEATNALTRHRVGRQNTYEINLGLQLRHPLEQDKTIADLLKAIS